MLSGDPDGFPDMADEVGSRGDLLVRDVLQLFCRGRDQCVCRLVCRISGIRHSIGGLVARARLGTSLRRGRRKAASARLRTSCAVHLKTPEFADANYTCGRKVPSSVLLDPTAVPGR